MRNVGLEPCEDVDFGVMVETPASCWIIDELCKEGINFVSFGTNDLTQ
ncbi:phosphoenolpyruvate-protein kinase (PTS system EI component), partial [Thermoplasmatales archaeon SCGC AB-539-C06]